MFFEICNGFGLVPFELNHQYIVFIILHESSCVEFARKQKLVPVSRKIFRYPSGQPRVGNSRPPWKCVGLWPMAECTPGLG
jgi:hypothetical protein